jgi:hypothetical protein
MEVQALSAVEVAVVALAILQEHQPVGALVVK